MGDMEGIYDSEPGLVNFVVRLSRTATGLRTYTAGASLPDKLTEDELKSALRRLFQIEKAIIADIDGPRRSARASGNGMAAQLRRSIVIAKLEGAIKDYRAAKVKIGRTAEQRAALDRGGWLTTTEILSRIPNAKRPQLSADLSYLVNEGVLEVEQSKGRNPSRYRLVGGAQKKGGA